MLPEGWKTYKLSELLSIIGGGTPKTEIREYWNGTIPWLSVVDFNKGRKYVYETDKTITETGLQESTTKILKKGQIIISARGTVGELAVLGKDMAFNQSCYGLDAKENTGNDFLFYLVKSSIAQLKKKTHGAVFDTITKQTFENIEVTIPEQIEEQSRIASILSSLDDKIELNLQMNKTLEAIAQAIFKEWFVDFRFPGFDGVLVDGLPKGWRKQTIGRLAENIQYGYTQSSSNKEIGPKFLRITDIQKGIVDWNKVPFCLIEEKELEKYLIKDHDIFVARTGASTGENIYIIEPPIAVFASYLIRLQFNCPELAFYVGKFMRRKDYFNFISASIGGSAQPNANAKTLTNSVIVIPEGKILKDYFNLAFPLQRRFVNNHLENQVLTNLRDSLLPNLMTGKIRVA